MKFEFRLEKILEFRRQEEKHAKDLYGDARGARLEAEAKLASIQARREQLLSEVVETLEAHQGLERMMLRYDDEEAMGRSALAILVNEEGAAWEAYAERRKDVQALEKLRAAALEEWTTEEARREQAELDEWAVTRRKA